MKTTTRNALLLPATIALSIAGLNAQSITTKSTSWDTIWGPSNRNAYVQPALRGHVSKEEMRTTTSRPSRMRYEAEGRFFANAKLFFSKKRAVDLTGTATLVEGIGSYTSGYVAGAPTSNYARASLRLLLGDSVIFSQSRRHTGDIAEYSVPLTAFTAQKTFYVCYIPITLRGSVGANIGATLGTVLTSNPTRSTRMVGNSAVGLSCSGTGYCEATAAVMLGWSGLGAGFEAQLRFLETTITGEVSGNTSGIAGRIEIRVMPLRLRLVVFAECGGRVSRQIYSWRKGYTSVVPRTFR